jgi:hypothetical protein
MESLVYLADVGMQVSLFFRLTRGGGGENASFSRRFGGGNGTSSRFGD